MNSKITIIDYGVSNLLNVVRAFDHFDADITLAETPEAVMAADRLVLPGVGAFSGGMEELRQRNLIEPIKEFCTSGKLFLGICLGMQMMLESSEEFGHFAGLGLIPGQVLPVPAEGADGKPHKVPHIGWNELQVAGSRDGWQDSIFSDVETQASMYFVHSFMAVPDNPDHRLADCDYDGQILCAAVQLDNMTGCQFHPEKSGDNGLAIIRRFLSF